MKEIITIVELLGKIKSARKKLDDTYNMYIDENSKSRAMISIYNPLSKSTINGADSDTVSKNIVDINNEINNIFNNLQKLLFIKEDVNSKSKLTIPSPYDDGKSNVEMSIAQILILKSEAIKKYKLGYISKLENDYNDGLIALNKHQETIMSFDRVDRYVLAKLNSLNIKVERSSDVYAEFAEEYKRANKMILLDPLGLSDNEFIKYKSKVEEFYETIDRILLVHNACTKIWIDLESTSELWGFV